MRYIRRFSELHIEDIPLVGGKNASLGEMFQQCAARATAEDLPDASFAGQQDTYLNIRGHLACSTPEALLRRRSSPTARSPTASTRASITRKIALSIGVQRMVRSDLGSAGVMFTIDTETGFRDAVFINAAYGLGENVVQGGESRRVLCLQADAEAGVQTVLQKRSSATKEIQDHLRHRRQERW
jgi:pyruvate,water dikinase